MRYASVVYHTEIPTEKLPDILNLNTVLNKYSKHSYHLGSWPKSQPLPTSLPKVNETSHVIHDVELNESGGLKVSYTFLASPRGFELMKKFDKEKFELIPIISADGCSILRFDFQKEDMNYDVNERTT